MQTALCPAAPARQGASDDQAVPPPFRLELMPAGHPDRASLEAFIAAEFARVYGARLQHYCQVLAGCRGADGAWAAALGYSPARDASLFLEQYLDEPIEAAIGRRLGAPVVRAIVKSREVVMRAAGGERRIARGLIAEMQSLGWGVLDRPTTPTTGPPGRRAASAGRGDSATPPVPRRPGPPEPWPSARSARASCHSSRNEPRAATTTGVPGSDGSGR